MKKIVLIVLLSVSSLAQAISCPELLAKTYKDVLNTGVEIGHKSGMIHLMGELPNLMSDSGFSSSMVNSFSNGLNSQIPALQNSIDIFRRNLDRNISQFESDMKNYARNCL